MSERVAHLAVLGGLPLEVFTLREGGEAVAGRLPEAPIRLDYIEVSRRHCRFYATPEGWMVEDLGSQWGTCVNGERIAGPRLLSQGDRVEIASVVLLFGQGPPPHESVFQKLRLESERSAPAVRMKGRDVNAVPLGARTSFGRDPESDIVLSDPAVSRRHAMVERAPEGYHVIDLKSTSGTFVNGHRFDKHALTIGDRLRIGPYLFEFDGKALNRLAGQTSGMICADGLVRHGGGVKILDNISLKIEGARFAGIIGLSGAGKSSLLDALSGMRKPDAGSVEVDGVDVHEAAGSPPFGYVPQQDIVHGELTVREALVFGAKLRLPRGTSSGEIAKLVAQTVSQLGLEGREETRVGRLSGGQRKRVSVGVELLARPAVLFLDEPSSGLDPATEFKLMELLRDLADGGCTIICTTHVVENIFLMDQLLVIHAGRLIFSGPPQEAREHFEVQKISGLYNVLEELPGNAAQPVKPAEDSAVERGGTFPPRPRPARSFPVLMRRQWAILKSHWSNFAILLGQPLLIGALVSWVTDDAALALFFAYLATLWFGCSNASQEIVKELPIFRRERVIGLGRISYLGSKLAFLSAATAAQAMLLYLVLQAGERGLGGAAAWQLLGLLGMSGASVAIGLGISALARTLLQAVLIVPLLLIPLILFSGYTVPAHEMKPAVAAVSRFMPTFAAQRMMDVSFIWRKEIARRTLSDHWTSFRNLNRDLEMKTGDFFAAPGPGLRALLVLLLWTAGPCVVAWVGLRSRERE